jgi:hypothetical protein
MTVQGFIDKMREEHGLEISAISSGVKMLYANFLPKTAECLPEDLLDVYLKNNLSQEFSKKAI